MSACVTCGAVSPNRMALSWLDEALRLDEECQALKKSIVALLVRLAELDELYGQADELIAGRWPE